MSASCFWDSWLLPLLQPFNKGLEFYITDPSVKVYSTKGIPHRDMDYHAGNFGQNPADNSQFQFASGKFDETHMDSEERANDDAKWHWGMSILDTSASDQTGTNKPHGLFRAECSQHCKMRAWLANS